MVVRLLLLCMVMLPTFAQAEIYKWKDKDGSVRYSDVPPPSNIQREPMLGKKIPKPTGQPPLAPVEGNATAAMNKDKAATAKESTPLSKEEAANKRAKDAEAQKKADEVKQADLKIKQENCKAAKSNLATFKNGGRITITDEKGERQYLGDEEIAKGKADAERDIEKYCD
ncbi:MAG: DUF4124 domain-containing protein [Methylotenera sp.]